MRTYVRTHLRTYINSEPSSNNFPNTFFFLKFRRKIWIIDVFPATEFFFFYGTTRYRYRNLKKRKKVLQIYYIVPYLCNKISELFVFLSILITTVKHTHICPTFSIRQYYQIISSLRVP